MITYHTHDVCRRLVYPCVGQLELRFGSHGNFTSGMVFRDRVLLGTVLMETWTSSSTRPGACSSRIPRVWASRSLW